jgi:hypothetical protein
VGAGVMELTECQVNELLAGAMVEQIEAMEELMLEQEQVSIPAISNNINGMYTRQIMIPRDTVLTGRVHLFDYVDIMLSGDITVSTPEGTHRYTGFNVFHGKAGRKRAGYAHEDTHWITVHNTEVSDGDEFMKTLTVQTMKDFNLLLENKTCQ